MPTEKDIERVLDAAFAEYAKVVKPSDTIEIIYTSGYLKGYQAALKDMSPEPTPRKKKK